MVTEQSFEWDHVIILKKNDKGMHQIQCKHCNQSFVVGPCRIRAHLLGLKGQGIGKCCKISVEIKEKVKRLVKDASGANVHLNDDVNVDASSANVDANVVPGNSMSINDLPSSSFVSSLSSKRKVLDKDQPLDEIFGMCIYKMTMLHSPFHVIGFLLHPI